MSVGGRGGTAARTAWRAAQVVVSATLMGVLLVVVLPRLTGASWSEVGAQLAEPSFPALLGLFAVWLLGLWVFAYVLAACLPGMTTAQGFVMNFTSSAVANLVPFGGMAGVAVSWWMVRAWGFAARAFTLYTLLTFVVNILTKAGVPGVALAVLALTGGNLAGPAVEAATTGAVLCAVVIALVVAILASERVAGAVGRAVDGVAGGALRLVRSQREVDWRSAVLAMRAQTHGILRRRWAPIVIGMAGYQALQAVLMWLCLDVVGGPTGWAEVLCAFAAGRLLTSVVLTPGGTGFAETGAAAVLVALGGDPASSVAGVLLFSVFTYVLEIPGGAVGLLVHLGRASWRHPPGSVTAAAERREGLLPHVPDQPAPGPAAGPPAPSRRRAPAP